MKYCAGRGNEKLELVGYSDSNMVGDVADHKITTGMIYFILGSAICRQSTKQKLVDFSSCEAGYITASTVQHKGSGLRDCWKNS